MKLIFELSGENETLPRAELECVGTVTDFRPQVAVADCPDPSATERLAMTPYRAGNTLGSANRIPGHSAACLRILPSGPIGRLPGGQS